MRVAVLGAGGPAGVNVCRALYIAGHEVIGIDNNPRHLVWCKPYCSEVSDDSHSGDVDLVHAQPEPLVMFLAEQPNLPKLMPRPEVIARTLDKTAALNEWYDLGLRRHQPLPIATESDIKEAGRQLGYPFWLRAATGAGARGATLVENLNMGACWFAYWRERNVGWDWIAEEYLPGRDYCWTSIWYDGMLHTSFTRQRLEWMYPHLAPSGRTGTPSISRIVHSDWVAMTAKKAVLALDNYPNGIYCVDLVEDAKGTPRPTEINAGRWATTSPLYSMSSVGAANLPHLHACLATGEPYDGPSGLDVYPAGITLSRHIDCGHHFTNVPVPA